jgi:hypothetical protein
VLRHRPVHMLLLLQQQQQQQQQCLQLFVTAGTMREATRKTSIEATYQSAEPGCQQQRITACRVCGSHVKVIAAPKQQGMQ